MEPPLTLTLTPTPTLTLTQVLFNTWVEAPLGVPQHAAASSSAGAGAGSGEAAPHAPCCRPRAEWSDAPPTRREGVGSEGVGSVKAKIWLLGDAAGSQRPTLLATPELGSCASSGGEPGSGRRHTPRGRYLATGQQLLPWVLELPSTKVADPFTVGHPGDERRRGQPERTRSVLAPAALEAALTEPTAATLFSTDT